MKKVLFALTMACMSLIIPQHLEATVIPIVGDRYMADIDDSSIKKYDSTSAAVGIKVYHQRHGLGNYFVIHVNWSRGTDNATASRADNGSEMIAELANTVAIYIKNNY